MALGLVPGACPRLAQSPPGTQARDELIETVKILELGQMSLDESLKYWERGEALAKRCELLLDGAATRVEEAIGRTDNSSDS